MKNILKTLLKWGLSAVLFLLKFWEWKVWKPDFWKGKTEYYIGFCAFVAWLLFEAGGKFLGWQTYPVGYFQKITFGILAMSIISGVAWIWLGATFPGLKKLIDPDTINISKLSQWQQLKISLFFYAFYAGGALLLASLY
jgi:hypothetical protein